MTDRTTLDRWILIGDTITRNEKNGVKFLIRAVLFLVIRINLDLSFKMDLTEQVSGSKVDLLLSRFSMVGMHVYSHCFATRIFIIFYICPSPGLRYVLTQNHSLPKY